MKHFAVALIAGLALAGCSSSDDEPTEAFCSAFVAATFTMACNAGCTVNNATNASDTDLDTFATLTPNPGQSTATVTFTATQTADLAAGLVPGVFVIQPSGVTINSTAISLYLNGGVTPVHDSTNAQDRVIQDVESGSGATGFLGLRNTPAFDKVEFTTTYSWSAGTPVYYIYEICSHGGNS